MLIKHSKIIRTACLLLLCLPAYWASPSYAWNAVGHELIASIAYDHLTPKAKQHVDHLTQVMDNRHRLGYLRFVIASTWADRLRGWDVKTFDAWHFIDLPYAPDTQFLPSTPLGTQNIIWAIDQSQQVLNSPKANVHMKAMFLNFLIHFVGDLHQPMHCISRYTRQYPEGDSGGGSFTIQSDVASNLHAYWDRGAGLFNHINPYHIHQIAHMAKIIQTHQHSQNLATHDLDTQAWSKAHYQIAKDVAYSLKDNQAPSDAYTQKVQQIIERQIALAGYRLANMLNHIWA